MANRQLGMALDFSETSNYALKWALDNLLRDGDKLILLIVLPKTGQEESAENLWAAHGSPLIPFDEFKDPGVMRRYGAEVNRQVIDCLSKFVGSKQVAMFGKVYYGDPRGKLLDAIVELPLDSIVMGSRGLGPVQKVFLGSVSNFVVNNAPCPVTVVKLPESAI